VLPWTWVLWMFAGISWEGSSLCFWGKGRCWDRVEGGQESKLRTRIVLDLVGWVMLMRWVKKKVLKDEDTDESLSHASGLPYIPGCLGLMMKSVLTVAVHWRCQDKWDWGVRFRWQRLSWWWHKWGKQSTGGCMQHGICFEFEACQVGCPRGKVSLTSIAFSIQYCWVSRSTWQKHGMWTQAWVTVDKLKILAKLWFRFFWGYCLVHLPQWDLG